MDKTNEYEKEARKKKLVDMFTKPQETKGKPGPTTIMTLSDGLIGGIAGGYTGAMLGRHSLYLGLAVVALGHHQDNRMITALGIGMMASGVMKTFKPNAADSPELSAWDAAKERAKAFTDVLTEKLFLDKIIKKKDQTPPQSMISGVGAVQYFTYPNENQLGEGEVDLTALDQIEREIAENAADFRNQQMRGMLPSDEHMGELDPTEMNY
jgi:hypothetical protein